MTATNIYNRYYWMYCALHKYWLTNNSRCAEMQNRIKTYTVKILQYNNNININPILIKRAAAKDARNFIDD